MRAYVVALCHFSSTQRVKLLRGPFGVGEGILQANGTYQPPILGDWDETDWYTLPGPACLWPDDPEWYRNVGLEVDPNDTAGTIKALEMMESGVWKKNWVRCMIRGDAYNRDYSIRWDSDHSNNLAKQKKKGKKSKK
jgi:hypothetical protein